MTKTRTESQIQAVIMASLKVRGVFAIRINSGMTLLERKGRTRAIRMAPAGTADILAMRSEGLFGVKYVFTPIWLEVKRPGAKQSAAQRAFQLMVESSGHRYAVVHDAQEALDAVDSQEA